MRTISSATCRGRTERRLKHGANDLRSQPSNFGIQRIHRNFLVALKGSPSLVDLSLSSFSSFGQGFGASLRRPGSTCLLSFKQRQTRISKSLLVFGGTGFGGGDISPGLLDRSLRPRMTLSQNSSH